MDTASGHKPGHLFFATDHLQKDLRHRSIRGGAITGVVQTLKFGLHTVSVVTLGRLLTPHDFGLVAMVTAVTNFGMMFKDMGLPDATVQSAEINHSQVSTLFWINVTVCSVITLAMAALGPVMAWFYNEPRLTLIMLALSSVFLLAGLTMQHQALLRRQMRFGLIAGIDITVTAVGVGVGVLSAWLGAGYWSLVLMQMIGAVLATAAVWAWCGWRPSRPDLKSGIRRMLLFGGNLTGFNTVNYFSRNLDNILIGKAWGADNLGFYNRAYNLLMLPIRQITYPLSAVAVPALSRLQDDPERYRRYYYRTVNTIAFVTMPLVLMLAVLSSEVIRIVLGPQWEAAADIFKVLAFAAILQPVGATVGWVYTSLGQTGRMFRWGLMSTPLIVLLFLIGLPWGPIGVATSYAAGSICIITIPCLWLAFRRSPLTVGGFYQAIQCPLLVGLVTYYLMEFARWRFAPYGDWGVVLLSMVVGLTAFGLGVLIWPKARAEATQALSVFKVLRQPNPA